MEDTDKEEVPIFSDVNLEESKEEEIVFPEPAPIDYDKREMDRILAI